MITITAKVDLNDYLNRTERLKRDSQIKNHCALKLFVCSKKCWESLGVKEHQGIS